MKKIALIILFSLLSPLVVSAQTPAYKDIPYAYGFAPATAMEFAQDSRIFVAERGGKVRVIKNGQLLPTPFLTVSVALNGERGLSGITLDPNFKTNGYVYIYYTRANEPIKNRLSRFTVSATNPDIADPSSEKILLDDIPSDSGIHNAGALHFGKDGKLYVSVGDGGSFRANAQMLTNLSGKILRLNSDGTIPNDNPFVGYSLPGVRSEIWAFGFRNPFTFAVDPISGNMFVNDVGETTWEEVNLLERDGNYAWPKCEGPQNTGVGECSEQDFKYPIHAYNHNKKGASITGAAFYKGDYYFGDMVLKVIRKMNANNVVTDFISTTEMPVDIDAGPDGSLYYLGYGGKVMKIVPQDTPVNGFCAVTVANICHSGTFTDQPDSATNALWSCVGSSGGTTASCSVPLTTNKLPTATITTPVINAKYNAGQTISFSGTGTDPEDGTLPASAFSWTIVFHHNTHTHPFLGPITGTTTSSFLIPNTGELADDVWYRIYLTVTDSKGAKSEVYRDVYPNVVTLTFDTAPTTLRVVVDGQPQFSPYTVKSVVGMIRNIGINDLQLDNDMYVFGSWSDGKARNHEIITPNVNTTYTATLNQIKPESITFHTFPGGSGDIAVNMQKEIDDRIAGLVASNSTKSMWLTQGTDTQAWIRNPNVFTNRGALGLNLSGQSVWNSIGQYKRSGTLVSPRHMIFAKHFSLAKDATVVFVNQSNEIIKRTVTKVEVSTTTDLGIALLDRDVPDSVPFYPVVPRATWEQYLKGIDGNTTIPIIYLNQNDKVGVHVVKANQFYNGSINMRHEKGEGKRAEFDEPVIGGDSGNPAFAVVGGQLILLFTHFDIPFGPNLSTLFNEVNEIMTRLGGGYQLSTVDLRDFTPAKPPTSTNRAPTAKALDIQITGLVTNINLEGTDPDGDPLTFTTGIPIQGTLKKETETKYTYTLTSLPNTAFIDEFNYYSSDKKLTSPAVRVTLRYTPIQYNLAVTKTGLGTVTASNINCGVDCAEKYSINTNVTLTATPGAGYTFTRWTGECVNTNGACSVTMDRARNVNAVFTLTPVPDADGDGILLPIDKCPSTPANLRNQVNRTGCVRPKLTKFNTKPAIEDDISALPNVELGIDNVGKIKFNQPVTLARDSAILDLDTNVIIEQDKVEIKSSIVPELNKPATITLYNIDEKNPRILRDGVVCTEPQCKIESFTNGVLTFTVTGFSIYTIEETPEQPIVEEPKKKKKRSGGGGQTTTTTVATQSNDELIAQLTAQLNLLIAELARLTGGNIITTNLSPGMQNTEVTKLQNKLIAKGYILPATGFYGEQTTAAVKKFQISKGISPTGSVGPQTRAALNN